MIDDRRKLAAMFTHPGVAEVYQYRPPYPDEVFDLLTGLISTEPSVVLDLGAGEGSLARPLAERVDQVDALDVSAAMIEVGQRRPGGDRPNLRWIVGAAETAPLGGPYALVTAGESLHWMEPRPTLTRLAAVLTDAAYLAMVERVSYDVPWKPGLLEVIRKHSRSGSYNPDFSLTDELAEQGLYDVVGERTTTPVPRRCLAASPGQGPGRQLPCAPGRRHRRRTLAAPPVGLQDQHHRRAVRRPYDRPARRAASPGRADRRDPPGQADAGHRPGHDRRARLN